MDLTFGLGGLIGTGINAYSQNEANKSNQEIAKNNIEMQRETNAMTMDLANTSYQRKATDMKAAGLNPLLAAGGSGAATPALNAPKNDARINPVQVDTNAMKLDASALIPMLTMANQIAISNSEASRANADARKAESEADLSRTNATVAGGYLEEKTKAGIEATKAGTLSSQAAAQLAAAEFELKKAITPSLVAQAVADAKSKGSTARYSDTNEQAKAGLNDQQWRQMSQMILEGVAPSDRAKLEMSGLDQQNQINAIVRQLKLTESWEKAMDYVKGGGLFGPENLRQGYVDAATAAALNKMNPKLRQ